MLRESLGWFNRIEFLKTEMFQCQDEGKDIN